MILINKSCQIIDIYEFQGEAENISKFDGKFNKQRIELEFEKYILKGRKLMKEISILENDNGKLTIISQKVNYYIFDKPPRYKI